MRETETPNPLTPKTPLTSRTMKKTDWLKIWLTLMSAAYIIAIMGICEAYDNKPCTANFVVSAILFAASFVVAYIGGKDNPKC